MQPGDDPPEPFSVMTDRITTPQIQYGDHPDNPATHEVIRANVHRSPMYSGQIKSSGPALLLLDRGQDRSFRRPRRASDASWSRKGSTIPRFIPTAFGSRCRRKFSSRSWRPFPRRTRARQVVPPGYAIEYDHVGIPRRTGADAGDQAAGLFLAGQINGTTVMRRRRPKELSPV